MAYAMTEEQQMAVDGLRRFLDEVIEPEFIEHGEGFIPREKMQKWLMALTEFGLTPPNCFSSSCAAPRMPPSGFFISCAS